MPARLFAAAFLFALWAPVQQQQQPLIRSGVELVLVDVQVTGRDGAPVHGLTAERFEVSIDGKKRPVISAELIEYAQAPAPGGAPAAPPSPSAAPREGRTIIIGIDQSSIQVPSEPAAIEAVTRLMALAHPEDAIGLVAFPQPGVSVAPTRDREQIRQALKQIGGQLQIPRTRMNISLSEASDFITRDAEARMRLFARECPSAMDEICRRDVEMAAREIASTFELQALRSVSGLRSLMEAVREYPGRKTVVIVSAGFASSPRMGGRPDVRVEADLLGQRAAEANAVLYSLHLDVNFLTAFSAASAGRGLQTVFRDSGMFANGLERFTGSAGGTLITVHAGPEPALLRLLRETSSYYVLAVEVLPEHRDGRTHRIQVKVNQRGAQIRSRSAVFIPKAR